MQQITPDVYLLDGFPKHAINIYLGLLPMFIEAEEDFRSMDDNEQMALTERRANDKMIFSGPKQIF